jgi:hypothetical protein
MNPHFIYAAGIKPESRLEYNACTLFEGAGCFNKAARGKHMGLFRLREKYTTKFAESQLIAAKHKAGFKMIVKHGFFR